MGVETYFLAVCPDMTLIGEAGGWWDYYLRVTPDIPATARGEAKLENVSKYRPTLILGKREARRRTQSYWRTMPARLAKLPQSLHDFVKSHEITGILCNHYFNLPIAKKLQRQAGGCKIVCETQDIQSRHMIVSNPVHPLTGVEGDYEAYFQDELVCCELADEFIHLNEEEYETFEKAMPHKRHHFILPSLPRAPAPPATAPDLDFLIVASANPPNYRSLCWFLDEVWDHELNKVATLRIVGNIDYMFLNPTEDERFRRFGEIFVSRVEDVAEWYHRARTVLAPTIDGQGISIKTLEALSYGRPFLFTPLAVRGIASRPEIQRLPGLCATADEFKSALRTRLSSYADSSRGQRENDTAAIAAYEALLAPEIYESRLCALFRPRQGDRLSNPTLENTEPTQGAC